MRKDQIFVLLLVVLLPMSGCFDGGSIGVAEGTENNENTNEVVNQTIVNHHYYNQSYNSAPVFHVAGIGLDENDYGRVSTYDPNSGEELTRMYHATLQMWFSVTDVDSNISVVGIDMDLDQNIDHPFTAVSTWNNLSYYESPGIAQSNGTLANNGAGEWGYEPYMCYARANLVAVDEHQGIAVHPITIRIDRALPYDSQGCQDDYTGDEDHS